MSGGAGDGGTLIYSPGVEILIDSAIAGPVDVSEDASTGNLTLRENGSHSLQITLENANRKYDGLFVPNDRVVVKMKRFRWLQVFSGYLDSTPYFSTYPGQVQLTAQCTLKVLRYWPWDRGSAQAQALLSEVRDVDAQDGGMSEIVHRLLTEVVGWEPERIHTGRVPTQWFEKFEKIYDRLNDDYTKLTDPLLGINPIIAGKPVGGFSMLAAAGGTTPSGPSIGDGEKERLKLKPEDYDVVMATIRQLESGNNYTAVNKGDGVGDWATGAYQFMDTTWANYRGYRRAMDAPPSVQDEKALAMIRDAMARYGDQLLNIPYSWYYPVVLRKPELLDTVPRPGEGNKLTIRQYGYKWVDIYVQKYREKHGKDPTSPLVLPGLIDSTTPSSSSSILYPIPAGITQLKSSEVGWGGHRNGQIPASALAYASYINGTGGHPLAVESWQKMATVAAREGINLRCAMYRNLAGQEALKNGAGVKVVGTSNHGWGLASDVDAIPKGPSGVNSREYQWLKANAYKYGWGHPSWAQPGGSKPEPWHWEFFAIYAIGTDVNGVNPFGQEGSGLDGFGSSDGTFARQLFSALAGWTNVPTVDVESSILSGYKAVMNDEAILPTIQQFVQASGRSYCAAPNGDFISWFPDYWGEYGIAGKMKIEAIELLDFAVDWSDEPLITHSFVEGALAPGSAGPAPAGILSGIEAYTTRGVATVDMPNLLAAILNVKDASQYPWLRDPEQLFNRFGARIQRTKMTSITGPHQEFYYAVNQLTRAWADQFRARAPLTFMPELFPGMIMEIPLYGVQMYVSQVSHSWDYSSGFTTTVSTKGVSATDGSGFYLFPKGGDLRPSGSRSGLGPGGGGGINARAI